MFQTKVVRSEGGQIKSVFKEIDFSRLRKT